MNKTMQMKLFMMPGHFLVAPIAFLSIAHKSSPIRAGSLSIIDGPAKTAAPSYTQKSVFKRGINPWKRLEGVPVGECKKVGLTGQDAQKIVLLDGVGNHESSV